MDLLVSLSLRRLRAFLVVCDTLHIGKAAQIMQIAQPALSQQIRSLEGALGVRLFHRRKRGIDLTEAGTAYREEARKLLAAHKHAADVARRVARGELGSLAVGYITSAMFGGKLPLLIRRMRDSYPDLTVLLREGGIEEIVSALEAGEIDIAFVRGPLPIREGLSHRVAITEKLMIALPQQHPCSEKASLSLADLADDPMISFQDDAGVGTERIIHDYAAKSGVTLQVGWRVSSATSLLGLVAEGIGWGFVPEGLARLGVPGVTFVPPMDDISAPLWAIWRDERILGAALRNILDL
ncbi:LysR substrate-binding domain-containing protein [Acetobacter sp. DsW_063]|uniref:LysR substrate-binding domain-containing protein n=1 Tax=Acetobacter sp. DsW_063 TaxID=1514894 RepID=UPI000A370F49|nr:LysR substrate-binding domain-containing protein [Acetobacter sp. DsW_063]